MRHMLLLVLGLSVSCFAQTPIQNLYAIGPSYNFNATPAVAGTALYGHYVASPGTYAFAAVDALPNTVKPFTDRKSVV